MVVNEKRNDIAILRTVGMSPREVVGVFFTQGIVIGWFGALLGCALGLLLALNVETIVPAVENALGMHIFDPNVYYITQVPSEVRWPQVAWITGIALVLTVVATIYPSLPLRHAQYRPGSAVRSHRRAGRAGSVGIPLPHPEPRRIARRHVWYDDRADRHRIVPPLLGITPRLTRREIKSSELIGAVPLGGGADASMAARISSPRGMPRAAGRPSPGAAPPGLGPALRPLSHPPTG
jgi:hypothetical protein